MDKEKQEEKDLERQVREMYTPLSVAKKEIWRRWNDKELKEKVIEYLKGEIPEPFKNRPRAVLSRHIISPNLEFELFLSFAKEIELEPLGLEGIIDRFCTTNPEKAALGRMTFVKKDVNGKKKDIEKVCRNIIDIKKCEGKKFYEIKTTSGVSFVDFHHDLLNYVHPSFDLFDDFVWFKSRGFSIKAKDYYNYYLAFFVCFGVLFENFYVNNNEREFTRDIVIPSFRNIEKKIGYKPIIVPLSPLEDETHFFWRCYPFELNQLKSLDKF